MNVFAIGASRNIGYYASLQLLRQGAAITFLLRSPSAFDEDEEMQNFIKSGHARLVQGDALNAEDVRRGWSTAQNRNAHVDLVLFTVGGLPNSFSPTQGFVITPRNLCTQALLTVLSTLPASCREPSSQPRIIVISSIGLSRASCKALPLLLKPLYGWLLQVPHADKLGTERVLAHCAGWAWADEEPEEAVVGANWQSTPGLPEPGQLKHVVVVRPAMLTDGACRGDKSTPGGTLPYRTADRDLGNGYTISRRDVGHFLVDGLLPNWEKWEGKCVSIAY